MTIEELGQRTKAKYPEYANMSDSDVGQRVLKKYPEYESVVEKKGVLSQAADFLSKISPTVANIRLGFSIPGLQQSTQSTQESTDQVLNLIRQARQTQDPQQAELLRQQAATLGAPADQLSRDITQTMTAGNVSERDLQRSNLEFAARRGAGQALETGSFLVGATPQVQALRAVPGTTNVLQRLAGAGLAGTVPGAFVGATQAALDAENIGEAGIDVVEGALVGGATSSAFQGLAEFGNYLKEGANRLLPKIREGAKKVYGSTLKDNIKDQNFYKQAGGRDAVVEDAVRLRVPVTKDGVQRELAKYGQEYGKLVDEVVSKSKKIGQKVKLTDILKKVKKETLAELNRPETRAQYNAAKTYFDDAIEFYGKNKSVTWADANNTRKLLDGQVGGLITDEITQGKQFAVKKFASAIRNQFKSNFPELKDPIRRYQLLSGLSDAFRKEPVFGLPEITLGAVGATSGGLGSLAGLVGGKAIRSPGLRRAGAAGIMNLLPQAAKQGALNIPKVPTQQAVPFVGAIQRALEKETTKRQEKNRLP